MQRRGTTCCARCRVKRRPTSTCAEKPCTSIRNTPRSEGTDAKGKTIRIERGTTGGDKFTLKLPGVSDRKSLEQRADEELKVRAYTGYEGSFTGWLEPYVEPTWLAEIRDTEYEYKNGSYYVLGVETTFCDKGASRVVTIGKRIENNG